MSQTHTTNYWSITDFAQAAHNVQHIITNFLGGSHPDLDPCRVGFSKVSLQVNIALGLKNGNTRDVSCEEAHEWTAAWNRARNGESAADILQVGLHQSTSRPLPLMWGASVPQPTHHNMSDLSIILNRHEVL